MECMALLTSQLEKQKQYWEEKLQLATEGMDAKNAALESELESLKNDFVNRAEINKEKANYDRKLKSSIEKSLKIQKELLAERNRYLKIICDLF